MTDEGKEGVSNELGHKFFGTVLYFLSVISLVTGFIVVGVYIVYQFIPGVTKMLFLIPKAFRLFHIVISYVTILWSLWALLSGLFSYKTFVKWLLLIHFAGYVFCFIVLEVIKFWWFKFRNFGYRFGLRNITKIWTFDQFQEEIWKGKKYALFDDYVVDLRYYVHPGGPHFINNAIG